MKIPQNSRSSLQLVPLILVMVLLLTYGMSNALYAQKQQITTADQLPRRTYPVTETDFLKALSDPALVEDLAGKLEQNLLQDLETYAITDPATLRGYYGQLQMLALRRHDFALARSYSPKIRDLSEKETEKLLSGLSLEVYAKAYETAGQQDTGPAFEAAYQEELYRAYAQLPYDKIEEELLSSKASLEFTSRELIVGSIKAQLQPVLDQMGKNWEESVVATLVSYEQLLNKSIYLMDERLAAIERLVADHQGEKKEKFDLWATRTVDFPASARRDLKPVRIGVWDTGVDMAVLPKENRFVNTKERTNGKDDDRNGFVDDVHGIAFDKENRPSTAPLLPASGLRYEIAQLENLSSGFYDLQANVSSEAAENFKDFMKSLQQEDMQGFFEDIGWYGTYAHGTHVAGIAQQGNPAAEILAARLEYSTTTIPDVPTLEKSQRMAEMYRRTVAYFQQQGVRVVNMSWRYNQMAYEGALAANGIGNSPEERAEMAKEMFTLEKDALYEAMRNAPEILFICGAGNENNSADFAEYIPAGLNLPNLITIGAVDIEGKKTSFTTEGESVDFYANGHKIESYVPGGKRMKFSGTSMASPQVANLAGKLLALQPALSVAELIRLIEAGCDVSEEGIKRINPKQSVSLLGNQEAATNR